MNSREMFQNVLNLRPSAPVPDWEFAYWHDTLTRWYGEGLPKRHPPVRSGAVQFLGGDVCPSYDYWGDGIAPDHDAHAYFGFDEKIHVVAVNTGPLPGYAEEIYDRNDTTITYRRADGKTVTTTRDGTSMPHFLSYPVKTREDFDAFKAHFDPESPGRFAAPVEDYARRYAGRTYPLQLGAGNFAGFYSVLRECMGVEGSLCGFYDQSDLLADILEFYTDFYIRLYSKVLQAVEVDYVLIWEDMCFKNGPLISPALFAEFCAPCYRKLIGAMRALGVRHFIVDTDGNFEKLLPHFLDVGVTGVYPFEVAAGMDVERTRREYPDLVIIGGVDKRALAAGKDAIDAEIRKIGRMLEHGGYLPCTDHAVTPDVSFENYQYFRGELRRLLNR